MDSVSVNTNFEYYPPSLSDLGGNLTNRKKILDTKKDLKKKLKTFTERNEKLEAINAANTHEIDELKKSMQLLNDVLANDQKTSIASTKIIELSKRNRQLKAELEATKSKYSKLEIKTTKLEKEIGTNNNQNNALDIKSKKTFCCHSATNIEQLEEQLNSTKQKLFEALNLNTELKNHLKLAQKCIQQEIGENLNLNLLASANTNWRGRAQQIISLQNKITELKHRLDGSSSILSDDTSRITIRKLEANRKDFQDELQNQIKTLNATVEEQKIKISALKARNKNLCDEGMNYKLKSLNLMEQSGINDNSIAAINEKINIQKYHYENKVKDLQKEIEDFDDMRKKFDMEKARIDVEREKSEILVENKQKIIDELNEEIQHLEVELKRSYGDFLFSCKDLKKSEFLAILDSLEAEKNSLTKLNNEINVRIEDEREKVKTHFETITKQKIKISRLEGRIKDLQKDQDLINEKKKRNQRITDYSTNLSSRLSVSGMVFENSNYNIDNTLSNNIESNNMINTDSNNNNTCDLDQLKNKVEFLNEKIEFLDEKLKIVQTEKDNDRKIFNEIMANSKNILLNMIQQVKSNSESIECRSDIENITYRPTSPIETELIDDTESCNDINLSEHLNTE